MIWLVVPLLVLFVWVWRVDMRLQVIWKQYQKLVDAAPWAGQDCNGCGCRVRADMKFIEAHVKYCPSSAFDDIREADKQWNL